jgi:hypothetical protein
MSGAPVELSVRLRLHGEHDIGAARAALRTAGVEVTMSPQRSE